MTEVKRRDFIDKAIVVLMGVMMTAGISQIILSATLAQRLKQAEEKIDRIGRDYTPYFIVESIIESNQYRADEIIAAASNDPQKVLEIQKKYNEMQSRLMKQLSDMSRTRGMSSTVMTDNYQNK